MGTIQVRHFALSGHIIVFTAEIYFTRIKLVVCTLVNGVSLIIDDFRTQACELNILQNCGKISYYDHSCNVTNLLL